MRKFRIGMHWRCKRYLHKFDGTKYWQRSHLNLVQAYSCIWFCLERMIREQVPSSVFTRFQASSCGPKPFRAISRVCVRLQAFSWDFNWYHVFLLAFMQNHANIRESKGWREWWIPTYLCRHISHNWLLRHHKTTCISYKFCIRIPMQFG